MAQLGGLGKRMNMFFRNRSEKSRSEKNLEKRSSSTPRKKSSDGILTPRNHHHNFRHQEERHPPREHDNQNENNSEYSIEKEPLHQNLHTIHSLVLPSYSSISNPENGFSAESSFDSHPTDVLLFEVDSEENHVDLNDDDDPKKGMTLEEYNFKTRMLAGQWDREFQARCSSGHLVKNQRVRYFHKASGVHVEGYVAAVHLDDGPDRPYYTVYFTVPGTSFPTEKQTTQDRLEAASWDGEKTWDILQERMGGSMVF